MVFIVVVLYLRNVNKIQDHSTNNNKQDFVMISERFIKLIESYVYFITEAFNWRVCTWEGEAEAAEASREATASTKAEAEAGASAMVSGVEVTLRVTARSLSTRLDVARGNHLTD